MTGQRWFRRIWASLAVILALCIVSLWPLHAQEGRDSYRDRTAAALARIDAAERALAQGDVDGVRAAMDGVGPTIGELATAALSFREVANREWSRCGERVQEFDRRVGDIRSERERVAKELRGLEETLAAVSERERLSSEQLAQIGMRMDAAGAALEERRRRLEELSTWWWVPGYGAYLAIRTLANHDIEDARSLANTLQDERVRLNQAGEARSAASRLKAELAEQIALGERTTGELAGMYNQTVAQMSELRRMALFLTEAEAFWLKASTLVQVNIGGAEQDMKILTAFLGKELTLSEFDEEFRPTSKTMREALLQFAASLDDGSSYLLDPSTDYCGGPPRSSSGANLSARCNLSQITRYFEVVDPLTCSFRYLNPPGCPPKPKVVDLGAPAAAAGRARGAWTQSPDQNWVGRTSTSPCDLEGSIYYGKLAGPDECEASCQGDPTCVAWTYNIANGFMPDSTRQCWGAPQGFPLNKQNWGGFQSGGLQP